MAGVLRASAIMASGTMVSRVLGLVRAVLLIWALGSVGSISGDAFQNGNLLPGTLYILLLGGALNSVLVPQVVRAMQNPDGGAGYINKLLTLVSVGLLGITVLAMLAAPWIVKATAVLWPPEQLALATAFAYWCLPQIVFYGLYTVLGEVLNARSVFGPFTWAPVLNNVISIVGLVVFVWMFGADPTGERAVADWTPASIAVLGGTATLGVAAQALILFYAWHRAGIRYRPDFTWRGMGLGRTARIAGWGLATITALQLGGVVTSNVVAVGSGEGPSTSAMSNAWLIFMMPHSVIAVSLATVYFTRLSEHGQNGRMAEFVGNFSTSVRQVSLVMMLASAVIFAAAPFISRIINFGSTQVQVDQFAEVLAVYMISLAAYSFLFVVQRAFYALSDARTPFFFTLFQIALVIGFSAPMFFFPEDMQSRVGVLFTLIWGIATLLEVLLATWLLRRKIGRIDGRRILLSLMRYGAALVPATAVGVLIACAIVHFELPRGALLSFVWAGIIAIAVSVVYLGVLWGLRSPELREIIDRFARRRNVAPATESGN